MDGKIIQALAQYLVVSPADIDRHATLEELGFSGVALEDLLIILK